MEYDATEVQEAVEYVSSHLGLTYPHPIQADYELGLHPQILSYEKLSGDESSLSPIERYIVGASSFLHQPCHYYDIFRACRHVSLIQPLSAALKALSAANTKGLTGKITRLVESVNYDAFEATLFEIVVAWRFLCSESVSHVEFIAETPSERTPDLLIVLDNNLETYCECKKLDRSSDFSIRLRNDVRDTLNPVISVLREKQESVVAELTFLSDPSDLSSSQITDACFSSLESGVVILEPGFHIKAKRLPPYESSSYKLFPSPDFYWGRYRYRERSEWFGIVDQVIGRTANHVSARRAKRHGISTWLDEVSWDVGIKWKIGCPELISKYRRFTFDLIFDGLNQINKKGFESILHIWLESQYCLGGRRASMLDLFQRLEKNKRDFFGWLILNEVIFDVSPKGYFDLIEHAHMIRGPMAKRDKPPISGVFADDRDVNKRLGEFGVGLELPDIDET